MNHCFCKKTVRFTAILTAVCIFSSTLLSGCKKVSEDYYDPTTEQDSFSVSSELTLNGDTSKYGTSFSEKITTSELSADTIQPESPPDTITVLDTSVQATEAGTSVSSTAKEKKTSASKTETSHETFGTYDTTALQTTTPMLTTTYEESTLLAAESMTFGSNSYSTLNYKEQKGFWFTYIEFQSILKNKTKSQFRNNIGEYFDNVKSIGFNTVYVHVRAFGDAYYDSDLFPATDNFNGTVGTKNSFDALQIMIEEAHDRGLSIHAWVNPMRLMTDSQMKSVPDNYTIKKWYNSDKYRGTYIVKSGDKWYLNPAYKAVTDLIADGVAEIAANYKVDGIQIDDYFYPTTAASFDSAAFKQDNSGLSLSNWRIKNVNTMVKKIYSAAHKANSEIVFGISPQGSVENNYNELYADVKTWCSSSGYCDYILPQVYFGFNNVALPYEKTILQWQKMCSSGDIKLVIGLAAYKIGAVDNYAGSSAKNEWKNNSDIISRQMALAKELDLYGGVAIYRYDSLFNPTSDVSSQVNKELKNIKK